MKDTNNIIVIGSGKHTVQYPSAPSFQNGTKKLSEIPSHVVQSLANDLDEKWRTNSEQSRDGGPVELVTPIAIIKRGIDCLNEAIADLEQMPSENVRLRIVDYIIKPDPIQGLPFSKELVKMMLQTQIELYKKQLEELNSELERIMIPIQRT